MAELKLKRLQKQQLGQALSKAGFNPRDFKLEDMSKSDSKPLPVLRVVHLASNEYIEVTYVDHENNPTFYIIETSLWEEGRANGEQYADSWSEVLSQIENWSMALRDEVDAEDPWSVEDEAAYEEMNDSDEKFSIDELPRIDLAVDAVIEELGAYAQKDPSNDIKAVASSLKEIEKLLKTTARNASKKEWVTVFKTVIATKIVEWGLENELVGKLIHTLVSASQDVVQLAEHAAHLNL